MAGHQLDRTTRRSRRIAAHHAAVMDAPTGRDQVAAAFARYRSAARRHPHAEAEYHAMATHINAEAQRLEAVA